MRRRPPPRLPRRTSLRLCVRCSALSAEAVMSERAFQASTGAMCGRARTCRRRCLVLLCARPPWASRPRALFCHRSRPCSRAVRRTSAHRKRVRLLLGHRWCVCALTRLNSRCCHARVSSPHGGAICARSRAWLHPCVSAWFGVRAVVLCQSIYVCAAASHALAHRAGRQNASSRVLEAFRHQRLRT